MDGVVTAGRLARFYRNRRVLVTGHTGFKGGWLATWLERLGAEVAGFALPPEPGATFFEAAGVGRDMESVLGDVRDPAAVARVMDRHRPEVVFHLAAQALVRRSYATPVETFAANVMGTAHVLEAVRRTASVRVLLVVSSDKCYEERERGYAYREGDPVGGGDPYSASKGAQELVVAAYRNAYFPPARAAEHGVSVATARAGNVIGGGDWAPDRLVPDCVRALTAGRPIEVRRPASVRPWQHVLEPLAGYLWLALRMWEAPGEHAAPWNFGPVAGGRATVRDVVEQVVAEWGRGEWTDASGRERDAPREAASLELDCTKAATVLAWATVLPLRESLRWTVDWYRGYYGGAGFHGAAFTVGQIEGYVRAARTAGLRWADEGDEAAAAPPASGAPDACERSGV